MNAEKEQAVVRRLLGLLAETSVHAGTGAQLGAVDLPIQRERHTEWPTIYGSGLKGVLRDEARRAGWQPPEIAAVFGPETEKREGGSEQERHAGALAISDARLLLFPVRTVGHAFAWITCPLALARLRRDAAHAGLQGLPELPDPPTGDSVRVSRGWGAAKEGIFLEEFAYAATPDQKLDAWGEWVAGGFLPGDGAYNYWKNHMKKALALVTDEDFRDFVRHGTEVVTRVRLEDEKKTVKEGALWTEEHLPSDTLLYCFVAAWRPGRNGQGLPATPVEVMGKLAELVKSRPVVQVGGKETVGHGFVALRLTEGDHA